MQIEYEDRIGSQIEYEDRISSQQTYSILLIRITALG